MYQVPHKSSISENRPRVPAWHPSDSDCTWSRDIKSIKTHCGTFFAWLRQTSTRLNCEKRVQRIKQIVDCCIARNKDMKKVVIVNGNAIFDIETLFARLLVVGQQRGEEVKYIFQYERSHVLPYLIDEFGCFRKGDKTVLVKYLGGLGQ